MNLNYNRRKSWPVQVAGVVVGADRPIVLQSMTSTSTMDTEASLLQIRSLRDAGAEMVRLTAQGSREARNIGLMRHTLREAGIDVPLVADIHFNPAAALAAAECCDKVRINPGNFVDPGRTFVKIDYTDQEYADELQRIDAAMVPLLDICRRNHTALRIGVNHGSLSDRIMSRYGDTPAGMVESAMEFLRVCLRHDFRNVAISIKASNVTVMVETMRRLVAAMDAEHMHFPLHLGVTEAGDGEDGRIKSAVGIGTLLAEGIGDTIRVSLSEPPEAEIPVAREIARYATARGDSPETLPDVPLPAGYDRFAPQRRRSAAVGPLGGNAAPAVVVREAPADASAVPAPDIVLGAPGPAATAWHELDADASLEENMTAIRALAPDVVVLLSGHTPASPERMMALMHAMTNEAIANPVVTAMHYGDEVAPADVALHAAIDLGRLLLNGFADGIMVESTRLTPEEQTRLAFSILQSTRHRITRTEYIACPGCGRTLYDLPDTLRRIREATAHLKGLKIGVMGCIVNGPGEMADADYGYVGAGPGRVSLYKGKTCVAKNIPTDSAVDRLVALIKENGDWNEQPH